MNTIEVKNLVKTFGKVHAVNNISFNIEEGKITGLLGPNGAGKTTTIQMLLDLVTPSSGSIKIFGKEMHKNREEILGKINFSSPYVSLPGNLKVWENLYTFARLYGVKDVKKKVEELATFFGIKKMMNKMTSSLSTGQLTRLNLAKALLNDPKLLLLDEPTASLDPDIADRTRKLLKKIQKERKVTILYTSHNMDEIEELCDRVIFLQKGKIVDDDSPHKLKKKYGFNDLNEVFLKISREGGNSWE
jgi:ABC-2 type transport system ATP-binding protein